MSNKLNEVLRLIVLCSIISSCCSGKSSGQSVEIFRFAESGKIELGTPFSGREIAIFDALTKVPELPKYLETLRDRKLLSELPIATQVQLQAMLHQQYLESEELKADKNLYITAIYSHEAQAERWVEKMLSPSELKIIDKARLRIAFAKFGVFVFLDSAACEVAGIKGKEVEKLQAALAKEKDGFAKALAKKLAPAHQEALFEILDPAQKREFFRFLETAKEESDNG